MWETDKHKVTTKLQEECWEHAFSLHITVYTTLYTHKYISLQVTKQESEDVFGKQKIAAEVCVWASVWKSHSRLQWLKYFHLQNAHSDILCLPALRNDDGDKIVQKHWKCTDFAHNKY